MRDRTQMMGLVFHEQSIHTCGQPMHESFDPDGPRYSAEDQSCRACKILDDIDRSHDEPGTVWGLEVTR